MRYLRSCHRRLDLSSLIVEVCRVDDVAPHPNADRLAIAKVKGWYTAIAHNPETRRSAFAVGDKCVYFPPDCILPPELSDRLGVTKFLGQLPKREDGTRPPGGRVLVANLRAFKSYGLIMPCENPDWEIGADVASHYGITKYEPPVRANGGDIGEECPAFHRYHEMENVRNFPTMIAPGEEVVVTEKIHGENCRLGLVRETVEDGRTLWRWMAGSNNLRRKRVWQKRDTDGNPVGEPSVSAFWLCFNPEVRSLLCELSGCSLTPDEIDAEPEASGEGHDVVLFGERFGSGVQDMWYGHSNGSTEFRTFDVAVDGKYLDFDVKCEAFACHGVRTVPIVYRGPYDFAKIEELAEGPTLVPEAPLAGVKNFREGVVVTTARERPSVTDRHMSSRTQVKCISFAYLARKDGTEYR